MEAISGAADLDVMMKALAEAERRELLIALLEQDPQTAPDRFTDAGSETALLKLHHNHLPKLADYGFITWNKDPYVIERGPKFDEIRPLLELLVDNEEVILADWSYSNPS